jgi:hypothetical protein
MDHQILTLQEIIKNCDQRKHFLTNRLANAWNKLPGEVVHALSVNSFKAKYTGRVFIENWDLDSTLYH